MNSAELTDHNSSPNTRAHTHNLARGREIKSYLQPAWPEGKERERGTRGDKREG